jgi:hypothetical protein
MKIRPVKIQDDICYVQLTKGLTALVDAADAHLVDDRNWYAQIIGSRAYAVTGDYERGRRLLYMHRVILGADAGPTVDHKYGNSLDNRRLNLRAATYSENSCNRGLPENNTSGFKGVCFVKRTGKWLSCITKNGETNYLGANHESAESAHAAYCKANKKLHGKYGRTR